MINRLTLCLLICLASCINPLLAQQYQYVFIGSASFTGSKEVTTYRLEFNDSSGTISGQSVMDILGSNKTTTKVAGKLDFKKGVLQFKETKLINTLSKYGAKDFCYVSATLKMKRKKSVTMFAGKYKGYNADGKTICGTGELTLLAANDLIDKLTRMAEKKNILPDTITKKPTEQVIDTSGSVQLQPGSSMTFICPNPKIYIELWDNGKIDGDIVRLTQDDKVILDQYLLTNNRLLLEIKMPDNKASVLKLQALNEGTDPPNTARMKVTSGNKVYVIDASTEKSTPVEIILKQ